MSIVTKHQYIEKYPIKKTDKYLILGTIHPHIVEEFKIDFFYGNVGSFWNILSEACSMELNELSQILKFLDDHRIGMSDMILSCNRDNISETRDAKLKNLAFNMDIKQQILNSDISTIFFTSSFNKNNAAKLFCKSFNVSIPKNWRDNYEFDIQLDNKRLKGIILLSPSGNANRGVANSRLYKNRKSKYINVEHPVKQFKIDFYKTKFYSQIHD